MEIVKFPEQPQDKILTASEWLRKVADTIEENYGMEVKLAAAVVTFTATDGSVYFYDGSGESRSAHAVMAELGLLTIAQNHLINITED